MFVLVVYLLAGVLQLQEVFAVSPTSASSLETNVKTDVADGVQSGQQQHIYIEKILNDVDESSSDTSLLDLQQALSFYPPSLDFGTWSVGTARSHLVTLVNKNANRSLHLSSISGQTPVFYSSFYEDKIVPPKGNTTFNVVFLPRNNGLVETNLLVHTSFGQAKFAVRGVGADCPYRLRPLIGIKAPLNATINPEIIMYNPHQRPIQIVEVYSSGGQFQLELPSGGQAGPQTLWEIPPLSSKPIIRIRFHGIQAGNFSAYIRIKIAGFKEKDEDILVVPVEFEILSNYGIYSPNPIIDFGRLIFESDELSGDSKAIKEIKLNIVNSGKEKFEIIDYKLKNIPEFFEIRRSERLLQLNTERIKDNYNIDGELIIISRLKKPQSQNKQHHQENGKLIEYPIKIKAEIFKGNLEFEKNSTIFITGMRNNSLNSSLASFSPLKSGSIEREFKVKNKFNLDIKINKIILDKNDTKIFNIDGFKPSTIIAPNNAAILFKISVLNKTSNFNTTLRIITNITTYEIPFVICTGLLQRYTSIDAENFTKLPDNNILDFGVVPFGDFSHFGFILIKNKNPIPVQYMKWNFTSPLGVYYHSMFLGCLKPYKPNKYRENIKLGIHKDSDDNHNWSGVKLTTTTTVLHDRFSLCMNITSGDTAVFGLAIQSFSMKSFTGTFKIWTEVEEIETLVKFVTVAGRIKVNQGRLHFKECFPGKRCSADIFVHSSFVKPMRVNWITVSVPGLIFEHHSQNGLPEIVPNAITDLGHIHFDPTSVCGNKCYLSSNQPDEPEVSSSNTKPYKNSNDLYFDETELRRRTDMYRRLKGTLQMITISLNTSESRVFDFNATVDLIWPKLVNGVQTIPTTEINQIYNGLILITNPSSDPLEIELKLSDPSKAKTTSLSLPMEVVEICVYCYLTDENVFSLNDAGRTHIIKPNSFMSIGVKFKAATVGIYSTLLHIKNNLTLYEAVWITGKAVQPQFRFGNRKPGSQTPLLFEINEKHLSICDRGLSSDERGEQIEEEPIIISTKRTFTARNNGEVPILIDSFQIGDRKCEGYGFKILDCNSFVLKANSSKKIDISFTPDFTAMRINRPLILISNLSYVVNYTLLATIPSDCIEKCARILQRPFWEFYFRKGSAGFLIIGSFFILTAAFIEADKILKEHIRSMSRDKGPVQPPLDLRNITSRNSNSRAMNFSNVAENDDDNNYSQEKVTTPLKNTTGNSNSCVRKRNSKRNVGMSNGTNVPNSTNKNKTWADELAKKVTGNKSKNDALDSMISPKPSVQEVKGKEEKQTYQNKKNSSHSVKDSPTLSNAKSEKKFIEISVPQIDSDAQNKKSFNNSKIDSVQSELKRSKTLSKKMKSSPEPTIEHFKDNSSNDLLLVKNNVNDNRITKVSSEKEGKREKLDLSPTETEVSDNAKEPVEKKISLDNQKSADSVLHEELILPLNSENSLVSQGEPSKKQIPNSSSPFTNSNTNNGSNSSKNSQKKYSKTPGRERKKGQNEAKRSERKESKYRTNLQSFFHNDPNNSHGNQNVWNLNQGSFSDVVASSKRSANSMARTSEMGQQKRSLDYQQQPFSKLMDLDWNEADLKNHETFGSDAMPINDEQDVSMTLGPIGSRKSPTSLWEPLVRSHHPTPSFLQQSTNPNSSFFSSNFPIASNYESSSSDLQSFGGTSGLLDHIISEATHQKQRQANEALISLLQQQSQHGNNHSGTLHDNSHIQKNNWQATDHSWNPMNFNSTSSGATRTIADGGPERRNYRNENPLIGSSSFIPDAVGVWHNTSTIRRPPPGLEGNSRPDTPIQYNINSNNGAKGNNIHNNTTDTGEENNKNKSYLNNNSNSNTTNNNQYAVAFQGAAKSGNSINSPVTMQTFDPFSSLSSIWSDTWINNSNKNTNNNNNNPAK